MLKQVGERKSKLIHITNLRNETKTLNFRDKIFLQAVISKLMHIMSDTEMAQKISKEHFLDHD